MTEPEQLEDWLGRHPWWAWGITIWICLAVFDLAEGVRWLLR